MSEPQSVDHWAALAGNLGAEPASEKPQPTPAASETPPAETESPVPTAPPVPVFRPAAKPVRPARRPAQPAAWDQLAGELGITPLPPPPPPVSAVKATPAVKEAPAVKATPVSEWPSPVALSPGWERAPASPASESDASVPPAELAAEIEAELTAWEGLDPTANSPESFEPQEALDVMDETADELEESSSAELGDSDNASPEAVSAEGEERRGRRRRRRGRGRGRGTPEARTGDNAEGVEDRSTEPSQEPEYPEEDRFSEGLEEESSATAEGEPSEQVRGEDREEDGTEGRRRERRRRGRRGDRDRRPSESFGGEAVVDAEEPEFADADEDESIHAEMDEESHGFEADDELDEGDESPRIGFRNIPTWNDAIGVLIGKNMESRAKNPGGSRGPGGRGRGGRGGGRGRDRGRDRRSDRR